MADDTYRQATLVDYFLRWASQQEGISNTDVFQAQLSALVEKYLAQGQHITECGSVFGSLEVIRTVLGILPVPADGNTFEDLFDRSNQLLVMLRPSH